METVRVATTGGGGMVRPAEQLQVRQRLRHQRQGPLQGANWVVWTTIMFLEWGNQAKPIIEAHFVQKFTQLFHIHYREPILITPEPSSIMGKGSSHIPRSE